MVGRNLLFSTYGAGWGDFRYDAHDDDAWLRSKETFVNRSIQIAGSFVIINSLNYQFAQSVAQHPSNISRRPSIISRLSER